ncbi:hypothetical protein [Actinoallomurus iriomotensis]|uniref:Uncharacterized protein n=1 Tax=Actinoallomurus iriomotensis TaxID=478107 RepID=A0A9W6R9Y4_9ACTN|nr:hypothetical protein [Actinoallomurus iriomotensis]GLY71744.1 hypothetical protein Airi01_000110 [Actinoallomurus iriomotensis]
MEIGADAVKLFPASASSPAVLRDMLTALPRVPVAPGRSDRVRNRLGADGGGRRRDR